MNDRFFSIALIVIFGLSGIILMLSPWIFPFIHAEKITALIGGGIGVLFAVIRSWILLREVAEQKKVPAAVKVTADDIH